MGVSGPARNGRDGMLGMVPEGAPKAPMVPGALAVLIGLPASPPNRETPPPPLEAFGEMIVGPPEESGWAWVVFKAGGV